MMRQSGEYWFRCTLVITMPGSNIVLRLHSLVDKERNVLSYPRRSDEEFLGCAVR